VTPPATPPPAAAPPGSANLQRPTFRSTPPPTYPRFPTVALFDHLAGIAELLEGWSDATADRIIDQEWWPEVVAWMDLLSHLEAAATTLGKLAGISTADASSQPAITAIPSNGTP